MTALRTFASLSLAALLGSGAALAQQEPPGEPTNPHSTENKDRPSTGAANKAQTEEAEKGNPHSVRNRDREKNGAMAEGGKLTANAVLERLSIADQGEVKMGQLAQQNGGPRSQEYGRMLEQDHQRGLQQVKDLAQQKSFSISDTPRDQLAKEAMKESQKTHDKLAKLHGSEFDKEFANAMIEDHQKDIEHLKSWRSSLSGDQQLTALLDRTLPVLERHLQAAQQLKHPAAQGRRP